MRGAAELYGCSYVVLERWMRSWMRSKNIVMVISSAVGTRIMEASHVNHRCLLSS